MDSNIQQSPTFDIHDYCLKMALGQFLSKWDVTRQNEVLAALFSNDEDVIDDLEIVIWEAVSDYSNRAVAEFIESAITSFEFDLKHVIRVTTNEHAEFQGNVRSLVAAIERGDPEDIAQKCAVVEAGLPDDECEQSNSPQ